MTGSLRSSARNPIGIALMGALILVFLVLGVGGGSRLPDLLNVANPDAVVTAGSHSLSGREFARIFEQQKQRLNQQNNQTFGNDFLVQNGFDLQLLQQIAMDQAEAEMLKRAGVVPSPSLVDAQIKQIPLAFDRVTGKFSAQQFTQFLASQGLTLRQVQQDITDELAERHFGMAVAAGFRMPRTYAALNAVAALQNRDVSYFFLNPAIIPKPAIPTDAQLLAFEKAHAAQLTRPETRIISLVRFSAAAIAPTITIDPAQVQKAFEAQKDQLSTPETRSIIQIPVKSAAEGAQAAARLRKGEDPAAIAKSMGTDPVVYTDKKQSEVADKKLAAAAFAMKVGDSEGPVEGELGMAALKVTKITPAKAATLESARPKIEADLRQKAAQDKAYALSEAFDTARQGGATIPAAAQKAGVAVQTVGPFTGTGVGSDGKPIPLISDKIAKAAFSTSAGQDTDIEDAGPGEYFALHVDKVLPPALPSLDEARPQLTQAYQVEQIRDAFRAKVEQLEAQIRSGKTVDAVAQSVGGKVVKISGMQMIKAQQYQSMGREFLSAAFSVKPGDAFAAGAPGGAYVGKIESASPGNSTTVAAVTDAVRGRIGQDYLRDMLDTVKMASMRETGARWNRNVALKSIGIDPSTIAGPKGKATGKAQ
ncbi:MAG: peptidyl-prolyl cis-trans isomerase [Caulobacteraceae bacterium]|nr:peptidyl-prolyl cis-trans isomerase [Caulobacteraceae bacterium]